MTTAGKPGRAEFVERTRKRTYGVCAVLRRQASAKRPRAVPIGPQEQAMWNRLLDDNERPVLGPPERAELEMSLGIAHEEGDRPRLVPTKYRSCLKPR